MDDIHELLSSATASVRAAIEAAYAKGFDAGKKQGERDASAGLKAKLASILGADEITEAPQGPACTEINVPLSLSSESPQGDETERAAPGTVKPVILSTIANSRGMTTKEIVETTGFKHNSVRGTLWTLQRDGAIQKDDRGRWVAVTDIRDAAKAEAMAAYQEAVRNKEALADESESASRETGGVATP